MPEPEPTAKNITAQYEDNQLQAADPAAVIPWDEARSRLAAASSYWLATVRPDGTPHVRPVLAVWIDGVMYSTTNPSARKGRNLSDNPRCAFTVTTDGIDLVVEGTAAPVDDPATLERVADAYHSKYEWPVIVRDDAFDAPYAAPSAGPPPYKPYAITPTVIYGLGTNEDFAPRSTRWRLGS